MNNNLSYFLVWDHESCFQVIEGAKQKSPNISQMMTGDTQSKSP
jgi:hypothetical protein